MCGRALKSTTCTPPQPQLPARNLKRSLPLPVNRWRQHGARSQHHHRLCLGLQLHLLSPRTTRSAPVSAPAHGLSIALGWAGVGPPAQLCSALLSSSEGSRALLTQTGSNSLPKQPHATTNHHRRRRHKPTKHSYSVVIQLFETPPSSKDITWRPPSREAQCSAGPGVSLTVPSTL